MSALSDALTELAAASAKVAALSGDGSPANDTAALADANRRAGVTVSDGVLMARLRSGQIAADAPEVLAAVAADQRTAAEFSAGRRTRWAEGKAAAAARGYGAGKGDATGTATDAHPSAAGAGRAEAHRRYGSRAA